MKYLLTVLLVVLASDTAARTGSAPPEAAAEQEIHRLLDAWHHAAATADEETFFGSMADGAVYLGTEAGERWTKPELMEWSKEYFDRETAWSFEPHDRRVYVSADGRTAWFEELLETWMGVCRGSGVLIRGAGNESGWKIVHYNLAVTVPNELIQDFIAIFPDKPTKSRGSQ
jgi:hypothetical protein